MRNNPQKLPPVSHASTATMIGTEAISRPLRELG
jgi:hypothetical protein